MQIIEANSKYFKKSYTLMVILRPDDLMYGIHSCQRNLNLIWQSHDLHAKKNSQICPNGSIFLPSLALLSKICYRNWLFLWMKFKYQHQIFFVFFDIKVKLRLSVGRYLVIWAVSQLQISVLWKNLSFCVVASDLHAFAPLSN